MDPKAPSSGDLPRGEPQSWAAAIQDITFFSVVTTDPEGLILTWNAGSRVLFGYSADEIIGRPLQLLFNEEDQQDQVPEWELQEAARTGCCELDRWMRRRDGTRFFSSGAIAPLRDATGQVRGFTKLCRDATDRKRREAEVERLAEERRLALDAANLGWWRFDLKSGHVSVDERVREIYGVAGERWMMSDLLERIHAKDRPTIVRLLEQARAATDSLRLAATYRIHRPDGTERVIESLARTYPPAQRGAGSTIVGTAADVTERQYHEEALRENEAWFRRLANAMPQIVWAARPDGHVDYYNDQWFAYTGRTRAGDGDESWLPATPDGERILEVWRECVRSGRTYELEYRIRRGADGMLRWHLGRAVPVRDDAGEIVRWIGTNTDIHDWIVLQAENLQLLENERRISAEAQRARQVAEDANRIKDEFLATVSHELRTPLNAIVGWTTLLAEDPSDQTTRDEGIAAIQRNAQAQAQLIEDILDVARITAGKMRINPRPIDLAELIRSAVSNIRADLHAKGLTLNVDCAGLPLVNLDPERMQQVFWNLLANAVKFTPNGGTVTVRAVLSGSDVILTVSDTGEGIAPEFIGHVFESFRQADTGAGRRSSGLGLGLAIARHLVEAHGGTIKAASEGLGQGSTFTVCLPFAELPATPARPRRPAPRERTAEDVTVPLSGSRVLVVDDDADARRVLNGLLSRAGAEVTIVAGVADAIGVLTADHGFHAVISDLGMPDEDGYVFARRLRAMETARGLRRLPLAALTAYTRERDRQAAKSAGFDSFLAKPIRPTELLETVRVLVQMGRS